MSEKWTTTDGTFDAATYVFDETGATVALIAKRGTDAEHAARVAMIVNAPQMLAACEASEQCIKDFIELWRRGMGWEHIVMKQAIKSLQSDALRLTKIALKKAKGAKHE